MPTPITLPPLVLTALTAAMRIAAKTDGAPARCARKACRRTGRCHATQDRSGAPDCGGGLSARAEASAVDMLVFFYKWTRDRASMH